MRGIGINLFHILIIAPLLFYISIFRGFVPLWAYQGILILGIIVLIYHTYRLITKWKSNSPSVWVNVIHVIFVAPLLIYIGKNAYDTPRWAFETLLLSAFATIGYHLYTIVLYVQELKTTDPKVYESIQLTPPPS